MLDNSHTFWNYNTILLPIRSSQRSPLLRKLREERRMRSRQWEAEKSQRQKRQQLQRVVLQLLVDVQLQPLHIDQIAERINHSRQFTLLFLTEDTDDLWVCVEGDKTWWMTSLRAIPDRLFY